MESIDSIARVREFLGSPNAVTYDKIKLHLNDAMIRFIQAAPLLMLSTVDSDGFPTVSPKGDGPGFVSVRDHQTLLIPERKGNKLALSFENIFLNP